MLLLCVAQITFLPWSKVLLCARVCLKVILLAGLREKDMVTETMGLERENKKQRDP